MTDKVTMSCPRRSTRVTRQINTDISLVTAYPDTEPATDFERKIAILNRQSYPSALFAEVDDIIVYALFASKRRQISYRACVPDTAFSINNRTISEEQGIMIRHIYRDHTQGDSGITGIPMACQALISELPTIFTQDMLPTVQQ